MSATNIRRVLTPESWPMEESLVSDNWGDVFVVGGMTRRDQSVSGARREKCRRNDTCCNYCLYLSEQVGQVQWNGDDRGNCDYYYMESCQ